MGLVYAWKEKFCRSMLPSWRGCREQVHGKLKKGDLQMEILTRILVYICIFSPWTNINWREWRFRERNIHLPIFALAIAETVERLLEELALQKLNFALQGKMIN